jgi:arginine transport system substrate-binding protein
MLNVNALTLKIGILGNDPPFSMQVSKNNLFTGFEAQLMTEICKRIQAQCNYVPMTFADLFPQLNDHKIDLAIGQISITLDRAKSYLFSTPYMLTDGQFITQSNSSIKTIEGFKSKTVGVYKGSLYKDYLLQKFNNQITIAEYTDSADAFNALNNHDVDGLLLSGVAEKYWIMNNSAGTTQFHTVGGAIPLGNGYGIMTNLQSGELIGKINRGLMDMESDGTYVKIYNLYFSGIH